jgi:hypothetical protein
MMIALYAIVLFLGIFTRLPGQEPDPVQTDKSYFSMKEKPKLEMRVFQVDKSISYGMDIEVVLTNPYDITFDILSTEITLPDIFPDHPVMDTQELSPGCERIFPFRVSGNHSLSLKNIFMLKRPLIKSLFFIPKKYLVRCLVNFKKSTDERRSVLQTSTEVLLKPPLSSVIFGGFLGAFLLALFIPAYRYLSAQAQGQGKISGWRLIRQVTSFFISGSIISIIVIFALQRMSESNLPINIVVDDYIGGIIIGLSSFKLCDWIYQKFQKTDDTKK